VVIARLQTAGIICLETFKEFPQMARFTLRDEGECCQNSLENAFEAAVPVSKGPFRVQIQDQCTHPHPHVTIVHCAVMSSSDVYIRCCFLSVTGKTIAIGKVLKLIE
jgi:hypothetical protein